MYCKLWGWRAAGGGRRWGGEEEEREGLLRGTREKEDEREELLEGSKIFSRRAEVTGCLVCLLRGLFFPQRSVIDVLLTFTSLGACTTREGTAHEDDCCIK